MVSVKGYWKVQVACIAILIALLAIIHFGD